MLRVYLPYAVLHYSLHYVMALHLVSYFVISHHTNTVLLNMITVAGVGGSA